MILIRLLFSASYLPIEMRNALFRVKTCKYNWKKKPLQKCRKKFKKLSENKVCVKCS